jgi:NAD(P)-dependent dehydrogenase (short-subunit alcohol dehydrogenase family)
MTKTVVITGADSGLGFSLVKRFLQGGYRVFAGMYRNPANLKGLSNDALTIIPLDVSKTESVREAARQVSVQTDSVDIVINNAGINIKDTPQTLEELDFDNDQFDRTMQVNTYGPLRMAQQFLSLLEHGNQKLLVNISSEAGSVEDCHRDQMFAYCMSKSALNMESKILHNYLQPKGFKVLVLHPGWMRSGMGGPGAAIECDESAEGVFALATKAWAPDSPMYMDYQGKLLRW